MSATIRQIVDAALPAIGEVAGEGVNTFSDDKLMADAVAAFDLLFKKCYWPQYTTWFQVTLDGVTGKITTDAFTSVRDFEDIYAVHRDGENYPMPILAKKVNPYAITGTRPLYWTSLPPTDANYRDRKILTYPLVATGMLNVQARVYPVANTDAITWNTVINLDKQMMVDGTAYFALSSDETNGSAAELKKQMMEMRYRDIRGSLADHPIPVSGTGANVPYEWFVYPN